MPVIDVGLIWKISLIPCRLSAGLSPWSAHRSIFTLHSVWSDSREGWHHLQRCPKEGVNDISVIDPPSVVDPPSVGRLDSI